MEEDILLYKTVEAVVNSRYPEMDAQAKGELAGLLIRREFKKGELLISEGEISKHIVFIGQGMVRQFYYKNNKDVTEHFSYEGCIMMSIESLFKQEPTRLISEALENTVAYYLPYDTFIRATRNLWELNLFYRKILEYSLIVSQIKADSWRFEPAHERYELLMKMHPEVIKRAPLSHIASYLLMTPETLSRVRAGIY